MWGYMCALVISSLNHLFRKVTAELLMFVAKIYK